MHRTRGARPALRQPATLPTNAGVSSPVESTSHAPGQERVLATDSIGEGKLDTVFKLPPSSHCHVKAFPPSQKPILTRLVRP